MIKVRQVAGVLIVTADNIVEEQAVRALTSTELSYGDKLVRLPAHYHVHRNPIKKAILRYIVDKEEGRL
jgi:hypothetical protein